MLPDPRYHWRRLGSRLHRLRLAVHARGWRGALARLAERPPAPADPAAPGRPEPAAPLPAAGDGRRVLLVDVSTPRPDRDSGSLRAFNLMRVLAESGDRVEFLPDDRVDAGAYTDALRLLGVVVHTGAGAYPHWFARHLRGFDVLVVSRYHLAEFLVPLARRIAPGTRIVLDTVDLHHLRERREADLGGDRRLRRLAAITRRRELRAVAEADVTWVVSPVEAALLREALPQARVEVLPNLHQVEETPAGFAEREGLLFVGGARHPPNVDALRWLLAEIFPLVRARLPDCALHVVGDGLAAAVAGLPLPPGVRLHGHVPDLSPLLRRCRVGLAPLRFGAGVKGKINLCMAAGMPVVATACAAEGMHARDGVELLVADAAAAFAEAVARLHGDEALWTRLARAGTDNVRNHFSFDSARATIAASFPTARC
ncbi:glycosyltransferase [Luteimonas sp. RD2P54]|uniref:Glycosyltransferase n=1 Tax=Luteimonas endophytica TaxID=3042023 RepID=A0ABT6J621_9GAMM|nr:glycosyltransferase [Luteimonas endophytica]MDH5822214.1 glycosyltransferase [Luteimonas endophytica]